MTSLLGSTGRARLGSLRALSAPLMMNELYVVPFCARNDASVRNHTAMTRQ